MSQSKKNSSYQNYLWSQFYSVAMVLLLLFSLLPTDGQSSTPSAGRGGDDLPSKVTAADLIGNAPNSYIVRQGDTLWDVAGKFLKDPKRWPDIWERNAHIDNPHWIYPGDEIIFRIDEQGQPHLAVDDKVRLPMDKVGPQIRIVQEVRDEEVISINQLEKIRRFSKQHSLLIMPEEQEQAAFFSFLANKPKEPYEPLGYIVTNADNRGLFALGDKVFIHFSEPLNVGDQLTVRRNGKMIVDPVAQEKMGMLVENLGIVTVEEISAQGVLARITEFYKEIEKGDLLGRAIHVADIPQVQRAEQLSKEGRLLHVFDNLDDASGRMVTIGLGHREGVKEGMMVRVLRRGLQVDDPRQNKKVTYPDQTLGHAVIFYVSEKASFALLTKTNLSVNVGDTVAAFR